MPTCIALFRGINVGGHHRLPMADLKRELVSLGLERVRTVIQSGNAVFDRGDHPAQSLPAEIADRIESSHGFRPEVLVLDEGEFRSALASDPFAGENADPSRVHFFFCASPPDPVDEERIEGLRAGSERWRLRGNVFVLHAPDGIGRSKLAAGVERALGVAVTARNRKTLEKIEALLDDVT